MAAQLIRRLRAENDSPPHQLAVLGRLDREGARTTSQLAAAERIRPQSMAQTVADLVAAGAVSRRPDPADKRQVLLELTVGGRELIHRERRARETWLAQRIAEDCDGRELSCLEEAVALLQRVMAR